MKPDLQAVINPILLKQPGIFTVGQIADLALAETETVTPYSMRTAVRRAINVMLAEGKVHKLNNYGLYENLYTNGDPKLLSEGEIRAAEFAGLERQRANRAKWGRVKA